ncbi:hypothetical protein N0V90_011058 [Kalmusia sp. IMI 367209]|nr:hypothetical protein N0V90_011058 [Kalmusia sp. IMI 367209]
MSEPQPTLPAILTTLLSTTRLAHPPSHATHPSLTSAISSLLLHPTLEATLHILNGDLPSAHFLVRHMQAPPAIEGMLLHSILHRCEGDMQNARLWASDVRDAGEGWVPKHKGEKKLEAEVVDRIGGKENDEHSNVVEFVYENDKEEMERLIDDVGKIRTERRSQGEAELENRIRNELEKVLEWCRRKFGDGEWLDASAAWVKDSEDLRRKGEDMVSGGKGWREF